MKVSVILPAAGLGTRMGREKSGVSRKQFMDTLEGAPILIHTIRKFLLCSASDRNRGGPARGRISIGRAACSITNTPSEHHPTHPVRFVEGGDSLTGIGGACAGVACAGYRSGRGA